MREKALSDRLARILGRARVLDRPIDLIAYASDASFYRPIPRAVAQPRTVEEVQALFRLSHELRVPLTFRAAGTSLSGQAITDGILVEVGRYWRRLGVEEGGKKVRVEPGVIGAHVNHALRPFGVKMGPDPASINTAMMGGILANNSSGMCCGVTQNAYHTLDSLTFVLPSGTVIDTADPRADAVLREREPRLAEGLLELKRRIEAQPALQARIRAKYRMHFRLMERAARLALWLGHVARSLLGVRAMMGITRVIRAVARTPLPQWSPEMPRPTRGRLPATSASGAQAVYVPSCISRVMGHLPGEPSGPGLMDAFVILARRADVPLLIPDDVAGTCCGVPFSSKGYDQAHQVAVNRAIERFWEWSAHGRLRVVLDTSPCAYGMATYRPSLTPENREKFDRLRILDGVAFVHDQLLPRLTVGTKLRSVALHPVCSLVKLGLSPKLEGIARACSHAVTVPLHAGCCGFAGDRGFLFPELTASATRWEAAEVGAVQHDGHFSSSRTCEIGMTRATGRVYRSYVHLVEEATRV